MHEQQYLSGLECGQRNPTIVTLYELAQALECSHLDPVQSRASCNGTAQGL